MENLTIEVKADHIDWKELVEKINAAIKEDTTDISSVELSFSECEEDS